MRLLHVLRHAKSSWEDESIADHDRPLAPRGEHAVALLADWVKAHDIRPELVVCSTAARTRATLAGLIGRLGDPAVEFDSVLYAASLPTLLERVRALPDVNEAMLVGHNPGLQRLVLQLATGSRARERVAVRVPTGALVAVALVAGRWDDVVAGCGEVRELVLPRELLDSGATARPRSDTP
jgi:phosphohistidine phosphatase